MTECSGSVYRHVRLGGVEPYALGAPKDSAMRVPDNILKCVCFLAVEKSPGEWRFGGTAFHVSVPSVMHPGRRFVYLVTAAHNVTKASRYGPLHARLNMRSGGTKLFGLTGIGSRTKIHQKMSLSRRCKSALQASMHVISLWNPLAQAKGSTPIVSALAMNWSL